MMGRRRPAALGLGVAGVFLASGNARAVPRDSGPLYSHIDTGEGAAAQARALAAKGDCAHALAVFDAALRSSIDMTVRRDRGLCHEALGDPFPAMDDYRAYLTVWPDAPDSNDIRLRLERLETLTGVGGPSQNPPAQSAEEVPVEPAQINDTTIATADNGKRKGRKVSLYDAEESAYRKYDTAMSSPLRRGTGAIFGIFGEGTALGGLGIGSTFNPGLEVGGRIQWSFTQASGVYGQIGYIGYNFGGVLSSQPAGGVGLGLGYELRIRLDQYATNQIVLSPAFEYQYVTISSLGQPINVLLPHGRVGYRVVAGRGFAFELVGLIGEPIFAASGFPAQASNYPVFGGAATFLFAF